MTQRNAFEDRLAAALTQQAESAMADTDTARELTRFQAGRRPNRVRVAAALAAAGVAAAVVAVLFSGTVVSRHVATTAHRNTAFPKLESVAAASPLPAGTELRSPRLETTVAPELVVADTLWSVNNMSSGKSVNTAGVVRSDAQTLRVVSTTRFSTSFAHSQTTQLVRVGDVVVLPMQGFQSTVGGVGHDAVLRLDARTGQMLQPLVVRATGVDVATSVGVFVQTDATTLGLLDPSGSSVVRKLSMPFSDAVVFAGGRLWGYDEATSEIVGVDPVTGRQVNRVPFPNTANVQLVAANSDSVLLVVRRGRPGGAPDGTYRLDTGSLRVTGGTVFGNDVPAANAWAVDGDRLWAAAGAVLAEFDPRTLRMIRAYTVPAQGLNDTGMNTLIPVGLGRLFVSVSGSNQISAFDLARLQ